MNRLSQALINARSRHVAWPSLRRSCDTAIARISASSAANCRMTKPCKRAPSAAFNRTRFASAQADASSFGGQPGGKASSCKAAIVSASAAVASVMKAAALSIGFKGDDMFRLRRRVCFADVIGRGRIAFGIEADRYFRKGRGVGAKLGGCDGERHKPLL